MKQYRIYEKTNLGWALKSTYTEVERSMLHDNDIWAFNWLEQNGSEYLKMGETMYDIVYNQTEGE